MSDVSGHHDETFEPATLGITPSSADALAEPPGAPPTGTTTTPTSSWPMWILGLVIMIDQVDQNIVRGAQNEIARDLSLSDTQVGLLLSCFVLVNGLVSVPAGYLADRWHRTRTIGHTVIAWSGITALTAAAPNYGALIGVRSALGFGQAITEPSTASLLADYYPLEQRGRAFSVQQVLVFLGFGIGLAGGGAVAATLGWRWSFLIVGSPGVLIAFFVYRLREPRRGEADRLSLGLTDDGEEDVDVRRGLMDEGLATFAKDLVAGLRADMRTILSIPTMRYALVGVSALLFSITAVGAALPPFYERNLGVRPGLAEGYVGAILVLGGIPGVLLGGRVADRFATRIKGARMAIPAYCVLAGQTVFVLSYLKLPLGPTFALQVLGAFIISLAVPALRAGLSDAVPANLRGAGFGAFNLVSVLLGQAAAGVIVFTLADVFDDNLRTALLVVSPPVFVGGLIFLRAKDHMDEDAAKIFTAIMVAVQEQQARDAAPDAAGPDDPPNQEAGVPGVAARSGSSAEGDGGAEADARAADDVDAPLDDDR
ncbi:MAG TPA: MFS transporter [Acidimicrobiales bacterium]|nr:MFS transporter [Acidimicrobiales bacterium]